MEKGYKHLWIWMAMLVPLTFLGFYKNYFSQAPNFDENNDGRIHWHTFVGGIWVLMLIIQPLLIQLGKRELHKKIGKVSYVLFPALIVTLVITTVKSFDKGGSMVMPVANIILISIFYTLAIVKRKDTPSHMRYMIGIAWVFVTPTLGRALIFYAGLGGVWMVTTMFSFINFFVLYLLIRDIKKGRDYRPYLIILIGFVAYQIALYLR
jgi:apolipoprotein N-acyltransferase